MESSTPVLDEKVRSSPSEKETAHGVSGLSANGPLISIAVVNYNGIKVLPKCLAALSALDYPHCEIIVVDNGSNDGSAEFAETFSSKFPLQVLRFPINRGVAAARNAGVKLAKGRYIAFIDNDGFAEPDWLSAVIDVFAENPRLGIIAPFVVFDRRPDIINGLGGGVSNRGIGFDYLYNRPLISYALPKEILYPMGNGMVIRQEVAALVFPIDEMLVNYYDDVEIGIRTWNCGYRVEPCPKIRVKHAFSHSSRGNPRFKQILCHRNRVRTVLKYWPLSKLPGFLITEFRELSHEMRHNPGDVWSIFLWNLRHLASALSIRSRYYKSSYGGPRLNPLAKELRLYPKNVDFSPDWERVHEVIDMETPNHEASLDFGWYYLETIGQTSFRYTTDIASAFLRTDQPVNSFLLRFVPYTDEPFTVELVDKATGEVLYNWDLKGEHFQVHSLLEPVALPPGDYQVLFRCDFTKQPGCGRVLGVGVNFIGIWNLP